MITEAREAERRVVQEPYADLLAVDDEALVLYEKSSVRLTPIAYAIHRFTVAPVAMGQLAERLTGEFGLPPKGDPVAATGTLVAELVVVGVLRYVDESPSAD